MSLPRLQLFEFNDHPRAPPALRESLVEALSRALAWGHVEDGLAEPLAEFLARAGSSEVLDLCSGAGGPAVLVAAALRRLGKTPPRFLLTDLHPHPEIWAGLRAGDPSAIDFVAEPVDATAIPPGLGGGRARMIVNALHHLPPALAGEVLRGACAAGPGVFIAEAFERNPLRFLPFVVTGVPAVFASPWVAPRRRLAKVALTPLALATGAWDGLVSTMRVYSEDELRAMVAPLGAAFDWRYGTYPYPWGGRGYWFCGVRAAVQPESPGKSRA